MRKRRTRIPRKGRPATETHVVRKHDWRTRWNDRLGRRPKTPAPTEGWLVAELARIADVPLTTVQYYVHRRLIRPIERRGTITRYSRRELLRLLGILRLKTEKKSSLEEKRNRLDALSDEELERWICSVPLSPAAAAALDVRTPASPESPANTTRSLSVIDTGAAPCECWQRIALLPGMDLMVRADVSELVRSAAQRICDEYLGTNSSRTERR